MRTTTTYNDHGAIAATDDHVALVAAENHLIAAAPHAALIVADAHYREALSAEVEAQLALGKAHARALRARFRLVAAGGQP